MPILKFPQKALTGKVSYFGAVSVQIVYIQFTEMGYFNKGKIDKDINSDNEQNTGCR
jgi:hypothetical protein